MKINDFEHSFLLELCVPHAMPVRDEKDGFDVARSSGSLGSLTGTWVGRAPNGWTHSVIMGAGSFY